MAHMFYFHQESFDGKLLYSGRLPENSLGVGIDMKMPWLDVAVSASFFPGFALGGLTVGQVGFRSTFRESPLVPAVGIYQQEFHRSAAAAVAHCSDLQRQS